MSQKTTVMAMIVIDILLGVLFMLSNYAIWDDVNAHGYSSPHWGPGVVSYVPRILVNGELIYAETVVILNNYPFWIFWIAMAANLFFIVMLGRKGKNES